MTNWTAIIPLNLGRDCKTRLSKILSRNERDRLVETMASHVLGQVGAVSSVSRIIVLSPEEPDFVGIDWQQDHNRGLNVELAATYGPGAYLVVHADLPLLDASDVQALLNEAESVGSAIAPDRLGSGTNALALTDASGFIPAFGEGSFALHRALLPGAAIVERSGLALDIDTSDDLDFAVQAGAGAIACPI